MRTIINTDLDGIISGMLLQKYMGWEVAGYSSCSGKPTDALWLKDNLEDCIFIDLPVRNYLSIDQHFISFEGEKNPNTLNPNDIRGRSLKDYTKKYPFGTAHFVLARLEQKTKVEFNDKPIENFMLSDLLFRADRVIGNFNQYTENCMDWSNWLMSIGDEVTKYLFTMAQREYRERLITEKLVEETLTGLGTSIDGDCSRYFQEEKQNEIKQYFSFLSACFDLPELTIYLNKENLDGYRFPVYNSNLKELCNRPDVFSYAFVMKDTLSIAFK